MAVLALPAIQLWIILGRQKKNYIFSELDRDDTPEVENTSQEEPWRDMDRAELLKAVNTALGLLSPEQREVFVMRQDGLSFKEIAKIHNCSINTALARMQYAMKNLQKELTTMEQRSFNKMKNICSTNTGRNTFF